MNITCIKEKEKIRAVFFNLLNIFPDLSARVNIDEYLDKISKYSDVFIIQENDSVCGFAAMYANDTKTWTAYVTLIGIDSAYRRNNLGSHLLNHCEVYAAEKGMKKIKLEVNKDNMPAIRFYEKNAFKLSDSTSDFSYYMEKDL